MNGPALTLFDVVALAIVAVSAIVAMMRGAVREVLSLASWVGAAVAAFLAIPAVAPLMRPAFATDLLAEGIAAVTVFLVVLVALKLLTGMVARAVEDSAVRPLDRFLGLGFGVVRGGFLLCAAYLASAYLVRPELLPDWVREARLIGPVREGAARIEDLLPETYRPRRPGAPAEPSGGHGYTEAERQALEKLVSPQP